MDKTKISENCNLTFYLKSGRRLISKLKYYFRFGGCLSMLLLLLPLSVFSEEPVDLETYRKKCSEGVTIYCLSAGIEEQKSGNLEIALQYYRSACESHSSQGNLRACTPYLSLASQMDRLDQVSAGFEASCSEGNDVICFYLAKEYFKIAEYHRGFVHLERLCQEHFIPPDALDYGPCYHLGTNLKKIRDLKRAQKIFSFDCERDPASAKPSCDQLEAVNLLIQEEINTPKISEFKTVEWAAMGMVVVPLLGLAFLRIQRKTVFKFLRVSVPVLTVFCWALWEPHARQEFALRSDLFFIVPAGLLALFVGWSANRKVQME